jgi:hypothetical protein
MPSSRVDRALAVDQVPAVCTDSDLMRVLGRSHGWFYPRKKRGEFRFLEVDPPLPGITETQYSGLKIVSWLNGDLARQLAAPRYFGGARRRA